MDVRCRSSFHTGGNHRRPDGFQRERHAEIRDHGGSRTQQSGTVVFDPLDDLRGGESGLAGRKRGNGVGYWQVFLYSARGAFLTSPRSGPPSCGDRDTLVSPCHGVTAPALSPFRRCPIGTGYPNANDQIACSVPTHGAGYG
jgi:hypothetical protein